MMKKSQNSNSANKSRIKVTSIKRDITAKMV